jgi:hypothetical protein
VPKKIRHYCDTPYRIPQTAVDLRHNPFTVGVPKLMAGALVSHDVSSNRI